MSGVRPGRRFGGGGGRSLRQGGAALVIGLILLLVLTVLAVSGMHSASVELVMAGNEQYRQNAFQAAEAGIENALQNGNFDGITVDASLAGIEFTPTDTYTVTITPQLNGQILSAGAGNTYEVSGNIHYEVQSQGESVRGARVTHWQGVAQLTPRSQGDFQGTGGL
ncbi:MAG: pilus assembly PilX N-terminal domain-containing protein [Gammaproteobacteria bacterium]|nr:pilus assembly PilX N-terminal domain-containing protein [Gammaproteobacteria bacterium]